MVRPASAPVERAEDAAAPAAALPRRKAVRLSIRDIMNKNASAGEGVESALKRKTRRLLVAKKRQHDQLCFELGRRQGDLAKLDAMYSDLRTNGAALGLHSAKDQSADSMRPVRSVSAKPVFCDDTDVEDLDAELEKHERACAFESNQTMIYKHMLRRYEQAKLRGDASTTSLCDKISDVAAQIRELERHRLQAADQLGAKKTALENERREREEEIRLWEREIASCEAFVRKREKVASLFEGAIERQRAIQRRERGLLTEHESKVAKDSALVARVSQTLSRQSTMKTVDAKKSEEQRYIQAFVRIGLKVKDLNPSLVLKTCLAQSEIRKDLIMRSTESQAKLENLNETIKRLKEDLNALLFAPPQEDRATNRVVRDHERNLHEVEKAIAKLSERASHLETQLRPVRIGVEHLASKLLHRGARPDFDKSAAIVFHTMRDQVDFLVQHFASPRRGAVSADALGEDDGERADPGGAVAPSDSTADAQIPELFLRGPGEHVHAGAHPAAQTNHSSAMLFQHLCVDNSHESSLLSSSPFNVRVPADPNRSFATFSPDKVREQATAYPAMPHMNAQNCGVAGSNVFDDLTYSDDEDGESGGGGQSNHTQLPKTGTSPPAKPSADLASADLDAASSADGEDNFVLGDACPDRESIKSASASMVAYFRPDKTGAPTQRLKHATGTEVKAFRTPDRARANAPPPRRAGARSRATRKQG